VGGLLNRGRETDGERAKDHTAMIRVELWISTSDGSGCCEYYVQNDDPAVALDLAMRDYDKEHVRKYWYEKIVLDFKPRTKVLP
jgi:hypothetical protein